MTNLNPESWREANARRAQEKRQANCDHVREAFGYSDFHGRRVGECIGCGRVRELAYLNRKVEE